MNIITFRVFFLYKNTSGIEGIEMLLIREGKKRKKKQGRFLSFFLFFYLKRNHRLLEGPRSSPTYSSPQNTLLASVTAGPTVLGPAQTAPAPLRSSEHWISAPLSARYARTPHKRPARSRSSSERACRGSERCGAVAGVDLRCRR